MPKDSDSASRADTAVVDYLRTRAKAHADILEGRLPTMLEFFAGAPFFAGEIERDIRVWASSYLENPVKREALDDISGLMEVVRDTVNHDAVKALNAALFDIEHSDRWRTTVYLACFGIDNADARQAMAGRIRVRLHLRYSPTRTCEIAVTHGLANADCRSMLEYCTSGFTDLGDIADDLKVIELAKKEIETADTEADAQPDDDIDLLTAIAEDRTEIARSPQPAAPAGLVVVPALPTGGTSWRKEIAKSWDGKSGVPLPLVGRGDVAAHRRSLVERWPHATDIVDIVLGDLAAREHVHFRPTLLVGSPGSGKSSLARAIFDTVGLPCELQSFAGLHDAALMGTSAQWSSARESAPLQLIKRAGTANVGIVWDEIEKASESRHNGAPTEALLPMLEPDQARAYRDLTLEVEVDLSMISHFATANSLDGVPAPLRDRMRVLTMPEPAWQHVGALSRQIIDRIAKERGLDARWYAPLAEDELDLVRQAWPGGSLRQLTRIVTTIVDGRDRFLGKC